MGKWAIRVYVQQGIFFVLRRLWVTKVLPICHIHNSHNAPYLPPKILHNLCFPFLLGITAVPREIENNAHAKFGGQIRYIMGNVEVAYFVPRAS